MQTNGLDKYAAQTDYQVSVKLKRKHEYLDLDSMTKKLKCICNDETSYITFVDAYQCIAKLPGKLIYKANILSLKTCSPYKLKQSFQYTRQIITALQYLGQETV